MIAKTISQKSENELKAARHVEAYGEDPDEAAVATSLSMIPAGRISNKNMHKDEQRRGHISSLWPPVGLLFGQPKPAEAGNHLKECLDKARRVHLAL
eukprot:CAMPEP_0114243942 /NCGR_PEP_ID=MMETSP0058-20121206/11068_1 /TAXON_ID=36894 /ORGANISM="Pyramimonas parkeae, CCMP726" /LENGTH=96 /DNA_ID=CAMNT_0001356835 /DNA_START=119 /DNA_END=410 /DNA_ORIENTATION=-